MRKTLVLILAGMICAMLIVGGVMAADKNAAPAKTPKFDQEAELTKFWNAPDDAVVGSVNGEPITKREVMKALWFWNAPSVIQEIQRDKLVKQAAAKAKVEMPWSELQKKSNESVSRMGCQDLDQLLAQYNVTKSLYYFQVKRAALAEKTVTKNVKVTDTELAEYIRASHILVKFPADEKDEAKRDEIAKKQAEEILTKVKGGGNFAELAKEFSQDPGSASKGGDLEWFSRGNMVPEFETAAFALKAGETSELVKSVFGYHIIKVTKVGKDATPAERSELAEKIMSRKVPMQMQQWFANLMGSGKLENKLAAPIPKEPAPAMKPSAKPVAPKNQVRPAARPATQTPPPAPAPAPDQAEDTPPPPPPPAQ